MERTEKYHPIVEWIDREKIRKHLRGIGRITQYYNMRRVQNMRFNFNDAH